jgi:hypothetical protein
VMQGLVRRVGGGFALWREAAAQDQVCVGAAIWFRMSLSWVRPAVS